ncbi:C-type lectin domain family 12 member B-like [Coccinella septempunctata]|uniref:C-type lectin domain family 12 member B-like n=1 Tax=Coccinella septempunctata TaxID=41139 RepID=UPI001D0689A2|nr:C-type lectin domain family 12 member B-like [Coccinella septempunctata]
MCVMKIVNQICSLIIIGIFTSTVDSNSTNTPIFKENSAYQTEEGIWNPLLEEWILETGREKRVMRLANGEIMVVKNENGYGKESKTHNSKVVNNGNGNNKPANQVSETDLYLLSAIEKLVYKVDSMEKRMRKVEEMLYYVVAGNRIDQDPCPDNFTRIGENCYFFAHTAGRECDWKAANKQCRKQNSVLAEFETVEENQDIMNHIQANEYLRGKEFWTGGLNPGLLWIWSNSARPVSLKNKQVVQNGGITGDGRCLKFAYNLKLQSYSYRGSDCSERHSYICEIIENSSINEIQRIAKKYYAE